MHKGKKEKKRRLNITWIKLHEFFSFAIEYNPSIIIYFDLIERTRYYSPIGNLQHREENNCTRFDSGRHNNSP